MNPNGILTHCLANAIVLVVTSFALNVEGVAECMSGNNLKCFECNSHENALCRDPFNWTTLPPLKQCNGCCVKMVQGIGTPQPKIVRTCTSEISVNLFMVDHVCMSESNRKGRLCFCEDDLCNASTSIHKGLFTTITIATLEVPSSFIFLLWLRLT